MKKLITVLTLGIGITSGPWAQAQESGMPAGGRTEASAVLAAGPKSSAKATAAATNPQPGVALGISVTAPSDAQHNAVKAGLTIEFVERKSPAEEAGLKVTDVLEKFNDQWLFTPAQLAGLLRMQEPGDSVTLTVIRGKERKTLTAKLRKRVLPSEITAVAELAQPVPPGQGPVHVEDHMIPAAEPPGTIGGMIDPEHKLLIVLRDGHKCLVAQEMDKGGKPGKTIFDGPIETKDQRAKVPQAIRDKLEDVERQMTDIKAREEAARKEAGEPGK
jgi:hypothetical protein